MTVGFLFIIVEAILVNKRKLRLADCWSGNLNFAFSSATYHDALYGHLIFLEKESYFAGGKKKNQYSVYSIHINYKGTT